MRRTVVARLVAVAAVVVTAGLLSTGPADAVANGQPATPGTYPFVVRFTMTDIPRPNGTTYDSACSGALIAPQWVITGGHCFHNANRAPVSGKPIYRTTVTLGTVNLATSHGETRTIVDVRQSRLNDVALAKLSAPITDIAPLGIAPTAPKVGQHLELAGWGATSSKNATPGTRLNIGKVAVGSVATGSHRGCTASIRRRPPVRACTTPARPTSPRSARRPVGWCRWRATVRTARTPSWRPRPGPTST